MIQYIDKLMQEWAAWTKVRRDGGLGYPSKAAGFNLMPASGNRGNIIGIDEQSMEIEMIVIQLRSERPELHKLVDWFYLAGNMTGDRIAKELGCHKDTMYVRLHAVHNYVMNAMSDNEINRQEVAEMLRTKNYLNKCA